VDASIINIDPVSPAQSIMDRAGEIITEGGVLIFPTQSLYGLGANALDRDAVERIFSIKQRPAHKPLLILINRLSQMPSLVQAIPPAASRIMNSCWPGGVTLICHAAAHLPANLTAGTGKIGIRMPIHPVARELVRRVSFPVTGTSANLSGHPPSSNADDIDDAVRKAVDMVLDAGELKGGVGSTIVDVTTSPPSILREGIVASSRILKAISGT
jgi:L-threonylcarbamoyladenylate synthase